MVKVHEIRATLSIAFPLIAAFLAQKSMQFIDTIMMGWIGPSALAAGAIGMSVFVTILVFCMGTLSAVGVFIARARGEKNGDNIQLYLQNGIWLAWFLSVPCVIVMWIAPHFLIRGEEEEVLNNAILLLHGLSLGLPGYLLFLIFREFISVFALTRIVMIVTLASIPLTFILNYIFVYGKWMLPPLGVAGIGYAGAIVMWLMFFGLFFYSIRHPQLNKYIHFRSFELSPLKDMLFIGLPSGTFFLLESGMFLFAVVMMGRFGVDELASFQIAMQCANFAYAIPFALSMTTALQVSHAVGSKEYFRLKPLIFQNFYLGLFFTIIIATCFILFPNFFIKIFLENESDYPQTIQIASSFLIIAAFFLCFDAIQTIACGILRGLKDTFIPMVLSVGCFWLIGASSIYYFSFHTSFGANGIWYGISLGITSLGIAFTIRLFQKLRKLNRDAISIVIQESNI